MPFDLSTARDVEENPVTGFDLDTATPVEEASLSSELDSAGLTSPTKQDEQTTASYVMDQIRTRYADWANMFARVGGGMAAESRGLTPEEQQQFRELNAKGDPEYFNDLLGVQGLKPTSENQKLVGIIAGAAADPINILTAPIGIPFKTGTTLLKTSSPYLLTALNWAGGTAAETTGYIASESIADLYKGGEYEGTPRDYISRFAGAFLAGGLTVGTPIALYGASKKGIQGGQRYLLDEQDNIGTLVANTNVKALLDSAIEAESGTFNARLDAVEALQKQFPDLVLPLANVTGDNPVIKKEFRRLYATDTNFRARYDAALREVKDGVDSYLLDAQGARTTGAAVRATVLTEAAKEKARIEERQAVKLANIEQAQGKVAQRYEEGPLSANVAKAADAVSESAEKVAKDAASIEYNKAFAYADSQGINFPANSVAAMWQAAGAQRAKDLFGEFDTIYSKINKFWAPKDIETPIIYGVDGTPLAGGKKTVFSAASLEDMDSFKRELNRVISLTKDETKKDRLIRLKTAFQEQITSVDENFANMYRNADNQYYQTLGLPTSAEGYRSIDSAKLATSVASALTRPEQIRDYLAFVGDAGKDVVRDAFLLRARQSILDNTGEVNPNKLKAFVARNKEALDEVPEVRAMFQDDVNLMERINRGRAKIESNYNAWALEKSDGFFKALAGKNLPTVASEVLSNPSARTKYLTQINNLSPEGRKVALKGLQQGLLDKAMSGEGTVFDYITANKDAFDDVFGGDYAGNLENLGRLVDISRARDIDLVQPAISHAKETRFKKFTGLSPEESLGTARNMILSTQRKLIHLGSKAYQVKTQEKADKALADALLDTKGLQTLQTEINAVLEAMETSNTALIGKTMYNFSKAFAATMGGYITNKGVLGMAGAELANDDLENERNMLPSVIEDDWLFAPKQQ